MIQSSGYEAAYLWFGLGQGFVVLVSALWLRVPRQVIALAPPQVPQGRHDHTPREVLRSPPFWLIYAMFAMVGAGGLMLQAQLAQVAAHFAIDQMPVPILGFTMLLPAVALLVLAVTNTLSRPFFGWVSDRFGREKTMFIAFMLEAFAFALISFANTPILFVFCVGLVFFAWGQIFSVFPSICTDTYGSKFASANYGMLYTAKGVASFFVPLANVLNEATGSWTAVFAVASALDALAAILAWLVLKPARLRVMAKEA
jgi:OFA family oxalate/formate antiporter-like MFS transporter